MPIQNKFVFFGTPTVASETLATLLEHHFIPALVVTNPDAPAGRGHVMTPSPVKTLALSHNLPVITPQMLDEETLSQISALAATYAICVAYGKIFPESLINVFPKGVLNIHYSLLPRHRGATPLEAALLAGDSETGVTIQKMVKELDAGDIIAQEKIPLHPDETAKDLRPKLITLGAELLVRTLPDYLSGSITPTPQDTARVTRAGKLKKEDGRIDLTASGEANWHKYCAYADTIGTYFIQEGKRVKIAKASFTKGEFVIERVIPEGKSERDF